MSYVTVMVDVKQNALRYLVVGNSVKL